LAPTLALLNSKKFLTIDENQEKFSICPVSDNEVILQASFEETTHDLLELVRPAQLPNRTGVLMVMAAIPAMICVAFLTVPELIFGDFGDDAYTQFARILAVDPSTFLPISLTTLCSGFGLFLPVKLKSSQQE